MADRLRSACRRQEVCLPSDHAGHADHMLSGSNEQALGSILHAMFHPGNSCHNMSFRAAGPTTAGDVSVELLKSDAGKQGRLAVLFLLLKLDLLSEAQLVASHRARPKPRPSWDRY